MYSPALWFWHREKPTAFSKSCGGTETLGILPPLCICFCHTDVCVSSGFMSRHCLMVRISDDLKKMSPRSISSHLQHQLPQRHTSVLFWWSILYLVKCKSALKMEIQQDSLLIWTIVFKQVIFKDWILVDKEYKSADICYWRCGSKHQCCCVYIKVWEAQWDMVAHQLHGKHG
jgi:hypothetical protein